MSVSASRAVAAIDLRRLPASGEFGGGQPRGLALDRDHGQVVRHDVVQFAGDAGPFLHHRAGGDALRHRFLGRVERGYCDAALANGFADDECGDDEEERNDAAEGGCAAVERLGRVEHERREQRGGEGQAAACDQLCEHDEEDAEDHDGQKRAV